MSQEPVARGEGEVEPSAPAVAAASDAGGVLAVPEARSGFESIGCCIVAKEQCYRLFYLSCS